MAVQLGHSQGAYECGFCSFTSSDHRVLVKHLLDHSRFKEKKHEHILWCALCKPLADANLIDGHQQAMTNDHLNGSVHPNSNDFGYGDTSNYYSGYNGLYNPYFFPNTYYYPMNIAYRNPCYGNVNEYYQTHTIFYTDDFYEGADIYPTLNTPQYTEHVPENKCLLDAPHTSENIQDENFCSTSSLNMTLSDKVYSNDSNSVNYDSSIEALPVHPQYFLDENSLNKFRYEESSVCEIGTFSTNFENECFNVIQQSEFRAISNIEPQPEVNRSFQLASDKTCSKKLNGSLVKNKLSVKEIPDLNRNVVERKTFQTNVLKTNDNKNVAKDLTESSNLELPSEAGSKGVSSSTVDSISAIETNSVDKNANTQAIIALNEGSCYSKHLSVKMAISPENDINGKASCTEELIPVSFPEADHTEKIVISDASNVENCSINIKVETLSKKALRKESNLQLQTYEQEASSENVIEKGSIPAQDMNVVPISDAETSPNVYTTVLTEDALDVETSSIDVNGPLTKTGLNETHSDHATDKLETLPKIQNSISVLPKNHSLVSTAELSPNINDMIVRENSVSNTEIQSICMNASPRTKKNKVLDNGKQIVKKCKRDGQIPLKIGTREDALNQNAQQESIDDSTEAITESSKKSRIVKAGDLSYVGKSLRNSCRNDLNCTNENYNLSQDQVRLTYSEVVKRGLPLKSSN